MTFNDVTSNEKAVSGALALVMHLLFLVLLIFGVSWQKKHVDTAAIVDLWASLPPAPQPKIETAPPQVKPPPEPPKPVPKVETRPAPPVEAKPVPKPDIAMKEKQEKERLQLEREKLEAKKREAKKLEAKKLEEEKQRVAALKEKQEREAQAQRLAKEQDDALKRLAAQQASAQAKEVNEYMGRIRDKIRRFIVEPPNVNPKAEVQFEIVVLPGGEVLAAKLKRSTNSIPAYDSAIERAILRAQPLPLPQDPALMREFRELNLVFRPKE